MNEPVANAVQLKPVSVKLPEAVAGEIRAYLARLQEDYSLRATWQELFWWLTGSYLTHDEMRDSLIEWIRNEDKHDYGAEKVVLFRLPRKMELDLRISLEKLSYDIGKKATFKRFYTFMTVRFIENRAFQDDFRVYTARRTRARTES